MSTYEANMFSISGIIYIIIRNNSTNDIHLQKHNRALKIKLWRDSGLEHVSHQPKPTQYSNLVKGHDFQN